MKKILVVSDSHGAVEGIEKALKNEKYDVSVNLGDSGQSESWIKERFDYYVTGNNDVFESSKSDLVFEVDGVRIAITHGDKYEASLKEMFRFNERVSRAKMLKLCRDIRADILLYGHSHIKDDSQKKEYRIVNPGSIAYPRDDRNGSYVVITVSDDKKIDVEFKFV
ncbi:MAG: metallophosphoesterase family protein [Mycoplasmataceae bacterium]|nr:metallophosphoesterase family protein [Mycoplasmataceae bacterium]